MIDTEVRTEIGNQVNNRIQLQQGFTAYDITQSLRRLNVRCKHDEVKAIVHETFETGRMQDYTRELRDLGGPIPAWYYFHRHDYAAQQYVSNTSNNVVGTVPVVNNSNSIPSVWTANADHRQTVCVPAAAIRLINLKPGETAVVIPCSNEIVIKAPGISSHGLVSNAHFYTVDKNNNVRITAQPQVQAGLSETRYTVRVENNKVILSAAD